MLYLFFIVTTLIEFFNNFKNVIKVKKNIYLTKKTKSIVKIAQILQKYGYIENILYLYIKNTEWLILSLNYIDSPLLLTIQNLKVYGNKSQKVFLKFKDIQKVIKKEFIILSTSKGILSGKEAFELGIGGNLICSIK